MTGLPFPATKRLLLVDDDESVRVGLTRALKQRGYAVTEAPGGMEGIELFEAVDCHFFDVVIIDYAMPFLTGGETVNRMRSKCPDQPVIYVSGFESFPGDLAACEVFLRKPVTAEELSLAVERLVKQEGATLVPPPPEDS